MAILLIGITMSTIPPSNEFLPLDKGNIFFPAICKFSNGTVVSTCSSLSDMFSIIGGSHISVSMNSTGKIMTIDTKGLFGGQSKFCQTGYSFISFNATTGVYTCAFNNSNGTALLSPITVTSQPENTSLVINGTAGPQGPAGPTGPQGPASPINSITCPSGKSLTVYNNSTHNFTCQSLVLSITTSPENNNVNATLLSLP